MASLVVHCFRTLKAEFNDMMLPFTGYETPLPSMKIMTRPMRQCLQSVPSTIIVHIEKGTFYLSKRPHLYLNQDPTKPILNPDQWTKPILNDSAEE
ncbi:MAG TPA: hypothetical protein VFE98_02610 [Candidatus Bathyarchaeia archaeon]|nr:hypothetical protein [Candidatus Bathyarchaeia archaeon]